MIGWLSLHFPKGQLRYNIVEPGTRNPEPGTRNLTPMFHTIPERILSRMLYLEERDALDRADGTPRSERLRQIPPETGRYIAMIAATSLSGALVEIGTSAGYSTLWLSLAARLLGRSITTFEILPEKVELARETFEKAGVLDRVHLVGGDARQFLPSYDRIAFCFLDAEKEIYEDCYEMVVPRLAAGGWLLADNFTSHAEFLSPLAERALADPRVDALVVPIGKGILTCRKI